MIFKCEGVALSKTTVITLKSIWRFVITLLHLGSNHVHNLFDGPHRDFALGDICSVKTVDAICSENATLLLDDFLLAKSFLDKEPEFRLNVLYLHHKVIDFMEIITMGFAVKIIPNMLQIFLWVLLQHLNQERRQHLLAFFLFLYKIYHNDSLIICDDIFNVTLKNMMSKIFRSLNGDDFL